MTTKNFRDLPFADQRAYTETGTVRTVVVESIHTDKPDVSVFLSFARDLQTMVDKGLIEPNQKVAMNGNHFAVRVTVRDTEYKGVSEWRSEHPVAEDAAPKPRTKSPAAKAIGGGHERRADEDDQGAEG